MLHAQNYTLRNYLAYLNATIIAASGLVSFRIDPIKISNESSFIWRFLCITFRFTIRF